MSEQRKLIVPEFKSQVPPDLLEGANHRDQWVLQKMDEIGRKTDWQSETLVDLFNTVSSVEREARRTNGRVTKLESEKNFFEKILTNKYFWLGIAVFFLTLYPYYLTLGPMKLKAIFSIFG